MVKTIWEVQPDVVVQYHVSMLKMNECTLLHEAKEISLEKLQQNGVMSGLMQMLLLKFHLSDQPIPATFKRAIATLSFWQKIKLAWGLCFLSDPLSKDDMEWCKQDLLEQMMAEMIGEFPDLHCTIVSERDIYLTYMLRQAAWCLELPLSWLAMKATFLDLLGYGLYWLGRHASGLVLSLPATQYCLQRAPEAWPHK
ncbi:hypothetical protein E2I00_005947 [Balaenoptera physalus]|uniref:Uncharacterized protein n=1 Tax=Balaenoptera physalus TaxID=9770 RepID=A0A6A1Q185_BALPH|nr:hypothetical protein E2I00_005947 [Balaenoptera physalus]